MDQCHGICCKCEYKGSLENSRHSTCKHPEVRRVINNSALLKQLIVLLSHGRPSIRLTDTFGIERNQQGIDGNWALWPFNFDPIWIKECTGFKELGP